MIEMEDLKKLEKNLLKKVSVITDIHNDLLIELYDVRNRIKFEQNMRKNK